MSVLFNSFRFSSHFEPCLIWIQLCRSAFPFVPKLTSSLTLLLLPFLQHVLSGLSPDESDRQGLRSTQRSLAVVRALDSCRLPSGHEASHYLDDSEELATGAPLRRAGLCGALSFSLLDSAARTPPPCWPLHRADRGAGWGVGGRGDVEGDCGHQALVDPLRIPVKRCRPVPEGAPSALCPGC